ncbi:Hypothetical_protein [Hexamita inflata]|uniref:Hypothetical_protein n=1 Tax=Hexamita inflata TaxID=28002 RepID=A0AA86P8X7_9EUKA|nr:Hypothetical protein HINF_LOCUS21949 [Hexamita inflata]
MSGTSRKLSLSFIYHALSFTSQQLVQISTIWFYISSYYEICLERTIKELLKIQRLILKFIMIKNEHLSQPVQFLSRCNDNRFQPTDVNWVVPWAREPNHLRSNDQ